MSCPEVILSPMDVEEGMCLKAVCLSSELKDIIYILRRDYCPDCGRLMEEFPEEQENGEWLVAARRCSNCNVEVLAEED